MGQQDGKNDSVCACARARVYRVAECRADGSWYGRGPGQASAVPLRPPEGPPEFTLRQHPRFYSGAAQSDTDIVTRTETIKASLKSGRHPAGRIPSA